MTSANSLRQEYNDYYEEETRMNDTNDINMVTPQRLDYQKASKEAFEAMVSVSKAVHDWNRPNVAFKTTVVCNI